MNADKKKLATTVNTTVNVALITVVAAVIIIPAISSPTICSTKAASSNNLAQIAKTYSSFSTGAGTPRMLTVQPGDTAHTAAEILAKYGYLNMPSFWFVMTDPKLKGQKIPRTIIAGDMATATLNPAFASMTLSVVFAANVSVDAPVTTTPIAWTRGLQPDGTWSKDSPWKGKGGHIAFLDGHVEWFDRLTSKTGDGQTNYLSKYGTGAPTANIREALPPGAVILSAEPRAPAKP